jgi:hypothetical protein
LQSGLPGASSVAAQIIPTSPDGPNTEPTISGASS